MSLILGSSARWCGGGERGQTAAILTFKLYGLDRGAERKASKEAEKDSMRGGGEKDGTRRRRRYREREGVK